MTIKWIYDRIVFVSATERRIAGIAQLAEQLICNQQVVGSSPITSSKKHLHLQVLFLMEKCPCRVWNYFVSAGCKNIEKNIDNRGIWIYTYK